MVEIALNGEVQFSCDLANRIRNLRGQAVTLRLDSAGGNFHMGMRIASEILGHGSVEVIAKRADSIASVIFVAGKRRLIHASGRVLFHRVSHTASVAGNCCQLRELANRLEEHDKEMTLFIATRTGIAFNTVMEWVDAGTAITATRAKELKLAHAIVGTPSTLQERLAIAR